MLEAPDTFSLKFFLGFGPDGGIVRGALLDEVPDDSGQFLGHGGDGFGGSQPGFPATEALAQIIIAAPQALGGQAQGHGGAAFDAAGFDGDDPAAGDAVIRAKSQPGAKAFGSGETGDEVWTQFGEQDQGGVHLEAGHLGQVDATKPVKFGAGVNAGLIALGFAMGSGW